MNKEYKVGLFEFTDDDRYSSKFFTFHLAVDEGMRRGYFFDRKYVQSYPDRETAKLAAIVSLIELTQLQRHVAVNLYLTYRIDKSTVEFGKVTTDGVPITFHNDKFTFSTEITNFIFSNKSKIQKLIKIDIPTWESPDI